MGAVKHMYESIYSLGYHEFLCDIAGIDEGGIKSYFFLIHALQRKEFTWTVPNDDNRASDAGALREEYFDRDMTNIAYSTLEVMIGIAIRCEEMMSEPEKGDRTSVWFWEMLTNLGLDKYSDEYFDELDGRVAVGEILSVMIEREYDSCGNGGLFPLINPEKDQRSVEIWYQMCTYLMDNYMVDD